jgi:murein DD-endopeptidase MepM/ murein hydrolase activator NlpD
VRRTAAFLPLALLLLGSRALGAPTLEVVPPRVKPGDVALLVVRGAGGAEPVGNVGSRAVHFYRSDDHAEAIVGIPVEEQPGILEAQVHAGGATLSAPLEIVPPEFPERQLTVARKFIHVPRSARARIAADQAAFQGVWALPFRPRAFTDNFQKPRDSEITAHFGDKRTLNGRKTTQHYGLDLDGATGDEVRATNDGRVVMVRDCYTSGNTVLIDHGGGLVTAYFHLSKFDVHKGEEVKRGQLLGLVGKTGRVTGAHLHFGAHIDGLWVNPQALLALAFPGGVSPPAVFLAPEPPDAGLVVPRAGGTAEEAPPPDRSGSGPAVLAPSRPDAGAGH